MEEYEAKARAAGTRAEVADNIGWFEVVAPINHQTWDRAMSLYNAADNTKDGKFEWYVAGIADSLQIDYQIVMDAIKIAAIAK